MPKTAKLVASSALLSIVFSSSLSLSAPVYAAPAEEPDAYDMTADALVARPFGLVLTTLGAAAFVVSLPFSALGGNVKGAAEQLVIGPGKNTFVRCLGCKSAGAKPVSAD
ncbi:MAG: hypothetical protein AAF993_08920 [Pseudomonadota bacterium]